MRKLLTATVTQEGRFLKAITSEGEDVSNQIERPLRRQAVEQGVLVGYDPVNNAWWLMSEPADTNTITSNTGSKKSAKVVPAAETLELVEPGSEHESVTEFIHNSPALKPVELFMSDIKWKYLVRSAMRGKNIMMVGPSGAGKTMATKYLGAALQRQDFYFNLGATQDPRSTLIGNVNFSKEDGTYFSEALFVKAIQTENANIVLDELSRAHPEAWNILMPVLDPNQRYLRLDEKVGSPTIKVAAGVCFIATANIGTEYTATRVIDRAIMDRFITIEMEQLSDVEECKLLQLKYPNVTKKALQQVAEIAATTRRECISDSPKLTNCISTRASIEAAGLLYDGFTLAEAAEVAFYPYFSADGGIDSERTFVKQIVQKYCSNPADEKKDLFGMGDINKNPNTTTF